jgi:hypothetical protein
VNIIGKVYSVASNTSVVTVQLKERQSNTVVMASNTYDVTIEGDFEMSDEALEDAVAVQLESAGVSVAPILG